MGWPVSSKGLVSCQPLRIAHSPLAPGEAPRGGRIGSLRSAPQASPHDQPLAPRHAGLTPLTSHQPPTLSTRMQVSGGGAAGMLAPGRGLQHQRLRGAGKSAPAFSFGWVKPWGRGLQSLHLQRAGSEFTRENLAALCQQAALPGTHLVPQHGQSCVPGHFPGVPSFFPPADLKAITCPVSYVKVSHVFGVLLPGGRLGSGK